MYNMETYNKINFKQLPSSAVGLIPHIRLHIPEKAK